MGPTWSSLAVLCCLLVLSRNTTALYQKNHHKQLSQYRYITTRHITLLRAINAKEEDNLALSLLNNELRSSPGWTASMPTSTADRSRIELAKLVVSTAVLLLTINVKVNDLWDKLKLGKSNQVSLTGESGPVLLASGVQYTDYYEQSSDVYEEPQVGDEVVVVMKLFFNGLQVNKDQATETLSFTCLGDENSSNESSSSGSSSSSSSSSGGSNRRFVAAARQPDGTPVGITSALSGMKYGVKRKALLPANLAFGEGGWAPYVPPGAAVLCEMTMSRKGSII